MPEIGRFAGRDIIKGEIEIPRTLNEYTYCLNSPFKYTDFNGMEPNEDFDTSVITALQDTVGVGASHTTKYVSKKIIQGQTQIKTNLATDYKNNYDALKSIADVERAAGKKGARTGELGWMTRKYNAADDAISRKIAKSTKIGKAANKVAGPVTAALDVGSGLFSDYNKGATSSKVVSNAFVNTVFAGGGLAASYAAAAVAASAVPGAGWIAAAIILAAIGIDALFRDKAKKAANSLD